MFLPLSAPQQSLRILFCLLLFVSLGAGSFASDDQGGNEEKKPGAENKAKDEKKEGAESKANAKDADKDAFTFVQITDSHIFDSGKERDWHTPQQKLMNKVEFTDSRAAWEWSMLEINRLAVSGKLDFVVFTGDFGLEKVTTDDPPPLGCFTRESAVDEVARSFASLLVDKVYVVRGNNDLSDDKKTEDVGRFDDFVEKVATSPRFPRQPKAVKVMNLTPALPPTPALANNIIAEDVVKGVRIAGLDSSSFKVAIPKAAPSGGSASPASAAPDCPYKVSPNNKSGYQWEELNRVAGIEQAKDAPLILFTHIPDLDDPLDVAKPNPKKPNPAAWQIADTERNEWNKIVIDHRLLAVFAGHLHDSVRSHYLPPYGWQANRGARLNQVYEKTYLAPPLAPKFQMDASPQARGYLLVTMTPRGVRRAEIRWYPGSSSEVIVSPPRTGSATRPRWFLWKCGLCCVLVVFIGLAILALLAVVLFLSMRRGKLRLEDAATGSGGSGANPAP